MVTDMFGIIGDVITEFVSTLGSALSSITSLFYTPGTSGNAGTFTVIGVLSLIAVGVGLVYWAFRLIRGLIAQRRA